MFVCWFFKFLLISFTFVNCDNKTKLISEYSTKYINDFENVENLTKLEPVNYDYENIIKPILENSPSKSEEINDNEDPQKQDIYPNPFALLNKSRSNTHHDENVIKIYTTRVRQPKMERVIRDNNQTNAIDLDLKGHDFIDSIMYIYYYGKTSSLKKDLGSNILIIGLVVALAGQLLTIIVVCLKNRRTRKTNAFFPITLNLLITLCLSNLLFIVGVQASKNQLRCEMIGLLLHYLHLTTTFWCFLYIFIIYDLIINESLRMKMKYNFMLAYFVPVIYVAFSYAASTNSFEKHKYCWMKSRELIINFMVPVFILIIVTTILGTICLKHISTKNRSIIDSIESIDSSTTNAIANGIISANGANIDKFLSNKEILASYYIKSSTLNSNNLKCCDENYDDQNFMKSKTDINYYDSKFDLGQLSLADLSLQSSSTTSSNSHDFTNFKNATKFALFFQPSFAICWFIGVLALENIHSYVFPTIFSICFNIMNWCILLKSRHISPFMKPHEDFYKSDANKAVDNENEEEFDEEQYAMKDKNNKNLLNQLFQNSNGENLNGLLGNGQTASSSVCTDQIPLLYTTPPHSHLPHHKSIANLPSMNPEEHINNLKNHRSEHDLLQKQSISNLLFGSGIDNYQPVIRNSWDTNLDSLNIDCISAISN